jgi:putative ABC transport system permease protein
MDTLRASLFIAYKSITRGNKSAMLLLVFILTLSFVNMMFVGGILRGLSDLFNQVIINSFSSHIAISAQEEPRIKRYITEHKKLRSQIESIPGVIATARRYVLAGSLSFDKDKSGEFKTLSSSIMAIDPLEEVRVLTLHTDLVAGGYLAPNDMDRIILSSALAGGYGQIAPSDLGGARIGDDIRITYANGMVRTYKVKGIYEDVLGLYQNFITVKEAESILGNYHDASQILVKVDLTRGTVDEYLAQIKAIAPRLKYQTYKDLLGSFASFLSTLDFIVLIVSTISVAVAAVTIFVLIYVNAINRRRQIGILKAIGIKQRIIVYSYVFQSLFYTIAGVGIGSLVSFGILYPILLKNPIDVDMGNLSLVFTTVGVLVSILIFLASGILAGFIPSRIVAKQDILKAIWG